jgi:DNA (cytosine-5)-methyltransferase 1
MRPIRIFEMFAGNRTPMFSLKKIGIEPISVGYSEIKKAAIEISKLNFPSDKNWGDCTKINPHELPDFDLLTAGFPCQDVSSIGKNDLSLGRTILFDEIIRIAEVKQPRFMLLENVKGLLSKKHNDFFEHIKIELKRIGYYFKYELLTSTDYNTPQKRQRLFFACFKNESDYITFNFPIKEEYVNDWHNYVDKEINFKKVNKTPSRDKMRYRCKNITNLSYCYTITQKQDRFPNAGIIDYEDYYRFLTPREQFRLMGFFEDEIKLPNVGKGALESLAGDGWDMNLVSKIFKEMFKDKILSDNSNN